MASLYLHIPFCEKKCLYCDFYSLENLSLREDFLAALRHEIELYASYGAKARFETIFFGGGTPSLLSPQQLGSILEHLHKFYSVEPDAEITVETNPGTVTKEKLAAYRSLGVNRLSIGIQSFHEQELKFLSRIHDAKQGIACVHDARAAGFDNVSIDLMYALPDQSHDDWRKTLEQAMLLEPDHVSAYGLIVEDGTPLARLVASGTVSPKPAEEEGDFYDFTMQFFDEHGYEHYEVSNYARPGRRSQHNYNYWRHVNYLGFGPSAHSFWQGSAQSARRWFNIPNLSHYCESVRKNALPLLSDEAISPQQLQTERIFLGLRSDGLDLQQLKQDFGLDLLETKGELIAALKDSVSVEGATLRLTRKGYLLCDEICSRLLP